MSNIVDDHRNMIQVSKNISSFQEENLKTWVFLYFENVKSSKVKWNFFKNNKTKDIFAGKITYEIVMKSEQVDLEEAKEKLTACVKFLFWNDTVVDIKVKYENN